jgi:signal peptidase I
MSDRLTGRSVPDDRSDKDSRHGGPPAAPSPPLGDYPPDQASPGPQPSSDGQTGPAAQAAREPAAAAEAPGPHEPQAAREPHAAREPQAAPAGPDDPAAPAAPATPADGVGPADAAREPQAAPAGPDDPAAPAAPATPADGVGPADAGTADPETADPETADAGGRDAADPAGRAKAGRARRPLWRELPLLIVVALAIALLIKAFVVQAFWIPSGSMENTLEINDKILVNKLVYHFRSIQPGDIIVFDGAGSWDPVPPAAQRSSNPLVRAYDATIVSLLHAIAGLFGTVPGQTDYIKRVIGVPGDRVACCNAQGLVTVNGVPLHEQSYLFPGETPGEAPAGYSGHFSITVPAGRLWVLGDNRAVSADSRLHQDDPGHGTIPENAVIGRAFMIVWPLSRWRILPIPSTFSQPGIAAPAGAAPGQWPGAVQAAPAAPFLPLGAGLAVAVPLTWLQRDLRRRRRRRSEAVHLLRPSTSHQQDIGRRGEDEEGSLRSTRRPT